MRNSSCSGHSSFRIPLDSHHLTRDLWQYNPQAKATMSTKTGSPWETSQDQELKSARRGYLFERWHGSKPIPVNSTTNPANSADTPSRTLRVWRDGPARPSPHTRVQLRF